MSETSKTAVLTGVAGTLGRVTAEALIAQGIALIGIDSDEAGLSELERQFGNHFQGFVADLSDESQVITCCEKIHAVDYLVNNAGILATDKFLQTSLADLRRVMAVNFESAYTMSQQLIPKMITRGGGRIVNVSSFAGRSGGLLAGTAYSLSKTALIGLTFSLAREFAPSGISVNAIAPAFVRSPMFASAFESPEAERDFIGSIPLRRLCEPEEVASAIAYLLSPHAGFINGEVLDLNGGVQCD